MDFAVREWLTVIVVLLIAGVVLDGWRRMRQNRQNAIKMSRSRPKGEGKSGSGEEGYGSELPNGGARVIGQRDSTEAKQLTENLRKEYVDKRTTKSFKKRIPQQVSLNLDESVPMLMDSVSNQGEPEERIEPVLGSSSDEDNSDLTESPEQQAGAEDIFDEVISDDSVADDPLDEKVVSDGGEEEQVATAEPETAGEGEWAEPDEVIILNVMAKEGHRIPGPALLESLIDNGMRYGDMNIFHRHKLENGEGPVLFSLANMVKPGFFDLSAMDDFTTPGISLFLTLPAPADSLQVFELMLSIAKNLAAQLGADLKDENRSVMTGQTIEHCRQRISEYERKRRLTTSH